VFQFLEFRQPELHDLRGVTRELREHDQLDEHESPTTLWYCYFIFCYSFIIVAKAIARETNFGRITA